MLHLRKRMLTLARFPSEMKSYSIEQMMDAADKTERSKYNFERHRPKSGFGVSVNKVRFAAKNRKWYISEKGKLTKK